MENLAKLIQEIDQKKQSLCDLRELFKAQEKQIEGEIAHLISRVDLVKCGIDDKKVENGLRVIDITPSKLLAEQERGVIRNAISDIAAGAVKLQKEYFGVKIYSGFGHQRSDHSYGCGPRHGSIVFRVGLNVRDRALSHEEIEDALYVLLNAEQVCKILYDRNQAIKSGRAA